MLHPAAAGGWDQAPVQVSITAASVRNALAVPVTALLATVSGSYPVQVAGPARHDRFVPVSLGLFDDTAGLVQGTGPGLQAAPPGAEAAPGPPAPPRLGPADAPPGPATVGRAG